jgi:hypothetical protein
MALFGLPRYTQAIPGKNSNNGLDNNEAKPDRWALLKLNKKSNRGAGATRAGKVSSFPTI